MITCSNPIVFFYYNLFLVCSLSLTKCATKSKIRKSHWINGSVNKSETKNNTHTVGNQKKIRQLYTVYISMSSGDDTLVWCSSVYFLTHSLHEPNTFMSYAIITHANIHSNAMATSTVHCAHENKTRKTNSKQNRCASRLFIFALDFGETE